MQLRKSLAWMADISLDLLEGALVISLQLLSPLVNPRRVAFDFASVARKNAVARRSGWAIFFSRLSITLNPHHPWAYLVLGFVYLYSGVPEKAREVYEQGLRALPEDPDLMAVIGDPEYELGRYREAEAAYRHALDLRPTDGAIYCKLAMALRKQRRLEEAVPLLQRAIELEPQDAKALVEIGAVRIAQGRAEEAIPVLTEATKIDPLFIDAHSELAHALALLERWEEALEEARTALKLKPDEPGLQANVELYEKGLAGELIVVPDEEYE